MPDGSVARCYAEELALSGVAKAGYPEGFEHHYYRAGNLSKLGAGSKPELIFVDSMSDLFGHWVPDDQVIAALEAMADAPHHTFQCLTKAPKRLLKYSAYLPQNLWAGVSSPPDFMMASKTAVPEFGLLDIPPAQPLSPEQKLRMLRTTLDVLARLKHETGCVTWMSLEPVSWDMARHMADHDLDWVVIGAASNGRKKYQPDPSHVWELLNLFDQTNTPVFFKGNIRPMFDQHNLGSPRLNRWREDFPVVAGWDAAVRRRQEMAIEHGWTLNTFLEDAEPELVPAGAVQGRLF
jgi:hypothetical protein